MLNGGRGAAPKTPALNRPPGGGRKLEPVGSWTLEAVGSGAAPPFTPAGAAAAAAAGAVPPGPPKLGNSGACFWPVAQPFALLGPVVVASSSGNSGAARAEVLPHGGALAVAAGAAALGTAWSLAACGITSGTTAAGCCGGSASAATPSAVASTGTCGQAAGPSTFTLATHRSSSTQELSAVRQGRAADQAIQSARKCACSIRCTPSGKAQPAAG